MTKRLLALGVGLMTAFTTWPSAQSTTGGFEIQTVSTRPDFVSGGDVLIRVRVPQAVPLDTPRVTLNTADITGVFRRDEPSHGLTGLVTGLKLGPNALAVTSGNPNGAGRLIVVNHPIVGPVFSGPHEKPFMCETENFKLQSGTTLGKALDAHCSVQRRVDYYYKATAGGPLKPLPPSGPPADLAQVTTSTGAKVPYLVRIETGTVNRGIYQIAMLHDPTAGPSPDPWTRSPGWHRRLVYTHGGGCVGGWYRQGANTGGVVDDVMLRQGYAVASSSLNVFGNNCNDLLASETMMMVKERFIEAYGAPLFTIGWGCSGGSYQQVQTAENYPGLLDGIIPCRIFSDMVSATVPFITDARLLNTYFTSGAAMPYTEEQKRAVAGFLNLATMVQVDTDGAGRIQVSEFCPDVLPQAQRFHPTTNPTGARCDVYDHAANALGRDPKTGFALRPLDNVGVQYGLHALNAGTISTTQFLDLNAKIGGFDADGNVVRTRSVANPTATRAAYRTGRLTSASAGLAHVPIIDYRNYLDDAKDGDVHVRYHSFSFRERLIKANGHADNHVMIVEDNRYRGNSSSPVYQEALQQMDRWLTAMAADASSDPAIVKIRRAKPADLVDACWTRDASPQKIAEKQTRDMTSRCAQIYPTASYPREVAGAPIASDVLKCRLKPVDAKDYKVTFSAEEMTRLKTIFAGGVCDWSKPSVDHEKLGGTWQRFPSGT